MYIFCNSEQYTCPMALFKKFYIKINIDKNTAYIDYH